MQVKICGLKDIDMMHAALNAGTDFVGLVFFEKSPRNVSLELAKTLAATARGRAKIVALVVNATDEQLSDIVNIVDPDYLQLHGTETPARCLSIASRFKLPIIKALGVSNIEDVAGALAYDTADIILFDTKADPKRSQLPGGNGIPFDWTILKGQKERSEFMLSGGLTPLNVIEAINLTGAAIVDVSSGVETSPGVKDAGLIAQFIAAAKN